MVDRTGPLAGGASDPDGAAAPVEAPRSDADRDGDEGERSDGGESERVADDENGRSADDGASAEPGEGGGRSQATSIGGRSPSAGDGSAVRSGGRPCPVCDRPMVHRHCKYVCPEHGVIYDCSDTFY